MAHYAVYKNKIKKNIKRLKQAFLSRDLDFQLFYSVKTNFSEPVLETIKESGSEYEILSGFEWEKVKDFNPKALVLNGPGKEFDLVNNILENVDVLYFNIDNDTDFEILKKIDLLYLKNKLKIGLRVYLNTEGVWNRFGYDISSKQFLTAVKKLQTITKLSGLHFHFSTNNFKIANYQSLLSKIKNFSDKSQTELKFLDIGGGLPVANEFILLRRKPRHIFGPWMNAFFCFGGFQLHRKRRRYHVTRSGAWSFIYEAEVYQKLPDMLAELFPKAKIISEAGRNIVADTVAIRARVISLKKTGEKKFQINIDVNIMHFQCFFEKKFWVEYLPAKKEGKHPVEIEIFGNSCMQVDKISDLMVIKQAPKVGDKVIIHNVGAYSFSQAANFISSIPEVKTYE